ncbi:MAG: hypothetical protein WB919_09880 [Candidatus Sulfotelmatobacter sp.]
MLPNLTVIIATYIVYRLLDTTLHSIQRNRVVGIGQAIIALICGFLVIDLTMETLKAASSSQSPLNNLR